MKRENLVYPPDPPVYPLYDRTIIHNERMGCHLARLRVMPAWDWENQCQTLIGTGLKGDGTAIWGKKYPFQ